jgi:hypothetical protein
MMMQKIYCSIILFVCGLITAVTLAPAATVLQNKISFAHSLLAGGLMLVMIFSLLKIWFVNLKEPANLERNIFRGMGCLLIITSLISVVITSPSDGAATTTLMVGVAIFLSSSSKVNNWIGSKKQKS